MEATLQPPLREEGRQTTFSFNGHAPKMVSWLYLLIVLFPFSAFIYLAYNLLQPNLSERTTVKWAVSRYLATL